MEKKKQQIMCTQLDRVQPSAVEIECAILGAMILEKDVIDELDLNESDFYSDNNKIIFSAIKRIKSKNNPVDIFTLTDELRKTGELEGLGGVYSITMLTANVASSSNIQYHSQIVRQKSISRKLIRLSSTIQDMAFDQNTDVADIFEYVEKEFTDITNGSVDDDFFDMYSSLEETLNHINKIQINKENGVETAIPTGLNDLDIKLNGGWHAPDLIILGGRPSMGKTQFAVNFAKYAGKSDNECLFVSIEMTKIQLIIRMLTEHEGIDFYKLKTGQLNNEEWGFINNKVTELLDLKLNIADDYNIRNISNIKSLARKLHRQGKLKLMIIDYLQLIKTNLKLGTRDLEIGYITGELKNLAKELNIPIILLAQLNRPMKGIKVSSPKLEDLRESGNIEQDADIVILPHRPTYYDTNAIDENGFSWECRGWLIIAKHREGEKDEKVFFKHDKSFKKIFDDEFKQEISYKTNPF
jgi:replicative DNA helicase